MTAPLLLTAISAAILLQIAITIGIAFWRRERREVAPSPLASGATATIPKGAWAGWRKFRVESDAFEDQARTQRSLILAPVDGLPLPVFAPGVRRQNIRDSPRAFGREALAHLR